MKIVRPTLLLDRERCIKNISFMAEKAKKHKLIFRPHFKTHQSSEVGTWIKDARITKCTVSSVQMAEYFANNGYNDITIAFPVNILEIDEINALSKRIKLNLVIESEETALFLKENLESEAGIFIKIDTGYHRTGISYDNTDYIKKVISLLSSNLNFRGLLTHSGHSYSSKNRDEVLAVHNDTLTKMTSLKKAFPEALISIGDTPSCSIADNFEGVDEIRPGNFVFYDLMQYFIGSCTDSDIATALVCPVVAKHIERDEVVLYGGGVHFSKEFIETDEYGRIFGIACDFNDKGLGKINKDLILTSLSQEHGKLKVKNREVFDKIKIGDLIAVFPIHSCMTANLMKSYMTFDNNHIETMR